MSEFVSRKLAEEGNTLAAEDLEKKAGKEGFSECLFVHGVEIVRPSGTARPAYLLTHVFFLPPHILPPNRSTAYVAEDDTKRHYDALMGLDLVLEEEEVEVTYK